MKVYGITGSISTGKSVVSAYLIKKGYYVVDSDKLAHDALSIDQDCMNQTIQLFDCLTDGKIDRKKLGNIVFHDQKAKQQLENIIHPYVISQIKEKIRKHQDLKAIFLDIPLLFEAKLEYLCNQIIVVYCKEEIELLRLMKRDQCSKEEAKTLIQSQMSIEEKRKKADIVFDNSETLDVLYQQVDAFLKERKL